MLQNNTILLSLVRRITTKLENQMFTRTCMTGRYVNIQALDTIKKKGVTVPLFNFKGENKTCCSSVGPYIKRTKLKSVFVNVMSLMML